MNANCIFILLFVILFNVSCTRESTKDDIFHESLSLFIQKSERAVGNATTTTMKSLEEKLHDPQTIERAQVWHPRAEFIHETINSNCLFLLDLKNKIRDHKQLISSTKAIEILSRLKKLRAELLDINESMADAFSQSSITLYSPTGHSSDTTEFYKSFFENRSASEQTAILEILIGNLRLTENSFLQFCSNKVPAGGDYFSSYSTIVAQNKSQLILGELLTIEAGVGAISKSSLPEIKINGNRIKLNDEGYSVYKIKTPKTPGQYSIPVSITYTEIYSGKRKTETQNVQYTVVKKIEAEE